MIYPKAFEEKIGFNIIRDYLKSLCISEMGKEEVDKIIYSTKIDTITDLLEKVNEFRLLLLYESPFPAQDYFDLRELYAKLHIQGTVIEIDELSLLRTVIQSTTQTLVYLSVRHKEGKCPKLYGLSEPIVAETELLGAINKILDAKGKVRDTASPALAKIRSDIRKISAEADKKIGKLLKKTKEEGIVNEESVITIRNGRLCIPVLSTYKRRISGFIHDESATGQTVFIEPTEVFDLNNELKDLLNAEKREIIQILTQITEKIRFSLPNLVASQSFLGSIDFIRAKAKFAVEIDAIFPQIIDKPFINWQKAIHPILFLNFKESKKIVEPLDIILTENQRILIISGPNAGGKSVCLKTVGLLQYMLQCGLLVPMKEGSEMGIFTDFFIDIGDEQSIENDLSTYSSHLTNLNTMLNHLRATSLFLIDEFGSGTEPALGGALSEAILEKIYEKKSFGIITTHYGNLKMFPDNFPEAINGAMLFDTKAMKPLFKLKIGKPGSSFTYEIAHKIGLSRQIIDAAILKSGRAQIDYERKLDEIEIEKLEIEKQLKLVNLADEQLNSLIEDYQSKFIELEQQRKEILQQAKEQATQIIESANKVIEKTIREIKESKADSEKTKVLRKEVDNLKKELKKEIESIEVKEALRPLLPKKRKIDIKPKKTPINTEQEIKIGDSVFISSIESVGEVIEKNRDNIVVSFNSIAYKTTIDKVKKVSKATEKQLRSKSITQWDGKTLSDIMNKKVVMFQPTIDLRGKRGEEAIQELTLYIDEAILLNVKEFKILHGKGNGILRRLIRDFLGKQKEVRTFRDEKIEFGGDGITVVEM
jgi:DNA mismatch repair protein MutS2